MKIRIKKTNPEATTPTYGQPGDAALDFYSIEEKELKPNERYTFKTGISIEIPDEYVLLIWDRSGLAVKHGVTTLGGVIDPNFRGEIGVCILNTDSESYTIKKGDRIAQGIIQPAPKIELEEVDELSDSSRGEDWVLNREDKRVDY